MDGAGKTPTVISRVKSETVIRRKESISFPGEELFIPIRVGLHNDHNHQPRVAASLHS
jgi:hypothetical protein